MAGARTFGAILVVLSIPLLVGAIVFMFSGNPPVPAFVNNDADLTGKVLGGTGLLFLLIGILTFVISPKKPVAAAAPVTAPVEQVVIKRTQMDWGANQGKAPSDALQAELDDVNRRIGRAKVQFGMGELSNESYRTIMNEYDQEKSAIEAKVRAERG